MGLNEISTSEIDKRIKATAQLLLGHHVGLSAILDRGQLGIACLVCEGRWAVVEAEGPRTSASLDLTPVRDGDGYCEEGATDYWDSDGTVIRRI